MKITMYTIIVYNNYARMVKNIQYTDYLIKTITYLHTAVHICRNHPIDNYV